MSSLNLANVLAVALYFGVYQSAVAEPLRILVPQFGGPKPLSLHVMTTSYLMLSKAFASSTADKGVWILYGKEPLTEETHEGAVRAASWPSTRADVTFWGVARQYGESVVVQTYLTLTPLLSERTVRPETWKIDITVGNQHRVLVRDLPQAFYEFEPFVLTNEALFKFNEPRGLPLYNRPQNGRITGRLGKQITFIEIRNDAMLLQSETGRGWIELPDISDSSIEAIPFSHGVIRMLRGDWSGAADNFQSTLHIASIPQQLRVDALLYLGLCKEKLGISGLDEFQEAVRLNNLDANLASYLVHAWVSQMERARRTQNRQSIANAINGIAKSLERAKLVSYEESWIRNVDELLATWKQEYGK